VQYIESSEDGTTQASQQHIDMAELYKERTEIYRPEQVDVASMLASVNTGKLSKLKTFTSR
jgi:hypothetical protein